MSTKQQRIAANLTYASMEYSHENGDTMPDPNSPVMIGLYWAARNADIVMIHVPTVCGEGTYNNYYCFVPNCEWNKAVETDSLFSHGEPMARYALISDYRRMAQSEAMRTR